MVSERSGGSVVAISLLAASLVVSSRPVGAAVPTRVADTVYRVRPDPRMCPSPACGGFWLTRVNASSTTCIGSDVRPACYVATVDLKAFGPGRQERIRSALTQSRVLLGGVVVRFASDLFPRLGSLVARSASLAAGSGSTTGTVYRVLDTGIRCIRAPCFSFRATLVNGTRSLKLSDLDLRAPGATDAALEQAGALLGEGGVLVSGTVQSVSNPSWPDIGRRLTAAQVWLPA